MSERKEILNQQISEKHEIKQLQINQERAYSEFVKKRVKEKGKL